MPGHTAIHDSVVMERAMKARGYEWEKPQGVAFREGWHDKDLDAEKYGAVYADIMNTKVQQLENKIEELNNQIAHFGGEERKKMSLIKLWLTV